MSLSEGQPKQKELASRIAAFIGNTTGLQTNALNEVLEVKQRVDGKRIDIEVDDLDDVLFRTDSDGHEFIQINLSSGHKILVTDTLIGFRPAPLNGLDMSQLPRVVTTPDIVSVFEAIQEALHINDDNDEVDLLKRVFDSVVTGGEAVGFDLSRERAWISRLMFTTTKITA